MRDSVWCVICAGIRNFGCSFRNGDAGSMTSTTPGPKSAATTCNWRHMPENLSDRTMNRPRYKTASSRSVRDGTLFPNGANRSATDAIAHCFIYATLLYTCVEGLVTNIYYPSLLPYLYKDIGLAVVYLCVFLPQPSR